MRAFLVAALASLALVAAGCGGASSTGSAGAPLGTDAAQLVPANALAFASIDTDQSSQQWQQLDALTSGLGARSQLMQQLTAALAKKGLSYESDVKPALGKQLNVAVLKGSGTTYDAVVIVKPDDRSKLSALASKFDQGKEHYTVEQIGGWSVVADAPDVFSAVRSAQSGQSLADTSGFRAAQSQVAGNSLARLYAASAAFASLAKQGSTAPAWAAAKIEAASDTIRASAVAAGNVGPTPSTSSLLRDVPSGAALAVAFKGGSQLVRALEAAATRPQTVPLKPKTAPQAVPLQQLAPLLTGPGVAYVRVNGLVPDVAVELAPTDPQAALSRARTLLSGAAGKLGPLQLTPQLVGGKLVISDSPRAASALRGGSKLVDDAAFKDALESAGAPSKTSALVYADMPQLLPLLQLAGSSLGGKPVDPTVTDTLGHVGAVVAWATRSGGLSRFELWAHRR